MADVTGPISSMPGSRHKVPEGMTCDTYNTEHEPRLAVVRIQGETDSFGSEMMDLCQECFDKYKQGIETLDTSGRCNWCSKHKDKLFQRRDIDEGMSGPLYDVCLDCIQEENARLAKELDYDNDEY